MNLKEAYKNESRDLVGDLPDRGRQGGPEGVRREAPAELAGQVVARSTRGRRASSGSRRARGTRTRSATPARPSRSRCGKRSRAPRPRTAAPGAPVLDRLDAIDVVYTQTWQYDDPAQRLADRLGVDPKRQYYSGIGGTTPQLLVQNLAEQILRSELDVALVVGAEALATQKRFKKQGERYPYSFKPEEKRLVPVGGAVPPGRGRARGLPGVADVRDLRQRAPRAPRRRARRVPHAARRAVGALHPGRRREPRGVVPDRAHAPRRSSPPTATNRMVGYPYTKYMVSIMDVDMAGALLLTSHEAADAMGVPADRRVYLRGWCYATDPIYVAEHVDLWRSPAMEHAASTALGGGGRRRRRRRAPRPLLVLRVVGELRPRRARASPPTTRVR